MSTEPTLSTSWSTLNALHGCAANEAWRKFIGKYLPFIRSILWAILHNERMVEDAEGDFWSYLFEHGPVARADRSRRFRPFLRGIVRNYALSQLRDSRKGSTDSLPDGAEIPAADEPETVQERLDFAENSLSLALDALHEKDLAKHPPGRSWLVLTLFYGLHPQQRRHDATEVAAELGTTVNNVYQLLHRTRLELWREFQAQVRETVSTSAEFEDEVAVLREAVFADRPDLFPPRAELSPNNREADGPPSEAVGGRPNKATGP